MNPVQGQLTSNSAMAQASRPDWELEVQYRGHKQGASLLYRTLVPRLECSVCARLVALQGHLPELELDSIAMVGFLAMDMR